MITRTWIVTLLTISVLISGSKLAFAVDAPNFPSCTNPQGTIKASYDDGTHGIVGDTNSYTGKDTVYQLENGNLSQCLCTVDGQGIQTNWWRDGSIDPEQRQILINEGWIYVPNGSLWGLDEAAYMTHNSDYNCRPSNGGGGPDGGDGLGCATHDCSNQGGVLGATGEVLGINSGEVLGLASTGGNFLPYVFGIIGVAALAFGVLLNIKSSKK